ncbi:vacuolar ATP synthase subunit G, putative [Metarhizium acridum CQMa 102]|uniref:Vacuolar ATP synthase subunit G, putative n=1 Tax=Metarhizium acridum (strain CQMa 102) TaxID=655827 RepID=E9DXW3_METAQ|nr:vacuolar ATP synthase subunit G, putative [Metarhizium acridum CQMa 102]EFY91576.1 vacuolar ATP synthase subunit G, putative [Metarhizium acridum CQMa 102]
MSAQNSAGIQTLLDVRPALLLIQDAVLIYPWARPDGVLNDGLVRTKRIREARDEAKKEIADYKASKEEEFKKFEAEVRFFLNPGWEEREKADRPGGAQHSRGNQQAEEEASKVADKEIQIIREAGSKGQAGVVKNLLSAVFDVKPVAPEKE